MKKYYLTLCFICLLVSISEAQQQVMYTQYMYNKMGINPAFVGSKNAMVFTGIMREQWRGWDGAPRTQTFTFQSPIARTRAGAGLMFIRDQIGVVTQNSLYGSFSYKVPLSQKAALSFGLQGGMGYYNGNYSTVNTNEDPSFSEDTRAWFPSFGFGITYFKENFYIGLSIPQLNNYSLSETSADSDTKLQRHYFITSGYLFRINDMLHLQPSMLLKYVQGAPVNLDLTLNALINELVWVGASWRSFESIDAMFMIKVNERLQFGYSYDFATSGELRRVNVGSHEIVLRYSIPRQIKKFITPRYY